jgi:hypothetical protein
MDCTVRVIKGPDAGVECRLKPGPNLVGRSLKAALTLSAPDISWEHLSITRTGDQYVVENLSAVGTYLDDARLTGPVKLRPRDHLRLSKDTVLRFEPAAGSSGQISPATKILAVVVILGCSAALLWAMFAPQTGNADWAGAYLKVDAWVDQQVRAKLLPPDARRLFRDAWRLEQSMDFADSRPVWLKLRLLLESPEVKLPILPDAMEYPAALKTMLTPKLPSAPAPEFTDDEMAAAFAEFIGRRLDWSTLQTKTK